MLGSRGMTISPHMISTRLNTKRIRQPHSQQTFTVIQTTAHRCRTTTWASLWPNSVPTHIFRHHCTTRTASTQVAKASSAKIEIVACIRIWMQWRAGTRLKGRTSIMLWVRIRICMRLMVKTLMVKKMRQLATQSPTFLTLKRTVRRECIRDWASRRKMLNSNKATRRTPAISRGKNTANQRLAPKRTYQPYLAHSWSQSRESHSTASKS